METTWELRTITDDIECTLDDSGIYTVINRVVPKVFTGQHDKGYIGQAISVRVDIMGCEDDYPVMSFVGKAENVRKTVLRFLTCRHNGRTWTISGEHASYIGSEIARAELDEHYVQS